MELFGFFVLCMVGLFLLSVGFVINWTSARLAGKLDANAAVIGIIGALTVMVAIIHSPLSITVN